MTKQMKEYLANTCIEVTFALSDRDYIYYQYVRGLITEQEAVEMLDQRSLDHREMGRMEKLAKHFRHLV